MAKGRMNKWVAIVFLTSLLLGCGSDSGTNEAIAENPPTAPESPSPSEPPAEDEQPGEDEQPSEPQIPAGYAGELQGVWESNCLDATEFGLTANSQLTFKELEATNLTRISSTGNCSTVAVEVTQKSTYAKQNEIRSGVFAIDLMITQALMKPVTETGVSILNLAAFCGYSDWQLNIEKDVTSRTGQERCFPKLPATVYQIYSVEVGEAGTKLYFGQELGDLTIPENRPTELNREREFTKPSET